MAQSSAGNPCSVYPIIKEQRKFYDPDKIDSLSFINLKLTAIPDSVFKFKNLKYLNLGNNEITKISHKIGQLSNLEELILKDNSLSDHSIITLPDELGTLSKLRVLDLSSNLLGNLSSCIYELNSLEVLDVSRTNVQFDNRIYELEQLQVLRISELFVPIILPLELTYINSFHHLDCHGSRIENLNQILPFLANLEYLNISNSGFAEFPLELIQMSQLDTLIFSSGPGGTNNMGKISWDIAKMNDLKVLVCSGVGLSELPKSLFKLPKLEYLDLSYNSIKFLPKQCYRNCTLRYLDLSGNPLNELPTQFSKAHISTLKLGGISCNVLDVISQCKFINILDLSGVNITSARKRMRSANKLENLIIGRADSTSLSYFVGDTSYVSKLKFLVISFYDSPTMPRLFYDKSFLFELDIRGGQLTNFDFLRSQSALRVLTLQRLGLETVPIEIYSLNNIEQIDLSYNKIDSLSDQLRIFHNLNTLKLGWNSFKTFPEVLLELSSLESLNLRANQISKIPENIKNLDKLKEFLIPIGWDYSEMQRLLPNCYVH